MPPRPAYVGDLSRAVEAGPRDAVQVLAALAALLCDPQSYGDRKGQPPASVLDYVQELVLTDAGLRSHLADPATPVGRRLVDGRWLPVWKDAREGETSPGSPEYDVCISFAGPDRRHAEAVAVSLAGNGMGRKVFYDEFEKNKLWGEDLFAYLTDVYANRSKFCVILFSHAYRAGAWTRHELKAAQRRLVAERGSYVLPVALDPDAVPPEFAGTAYWTFADGDGTRIAEVLEDRINDYIGRFYMTVEEITEAINVDLAASAILDGFRAGVRECTPDDPGRAAVLRVLALVAAADVSALDPTARATVRLVLYDPGPVADAFDDDRVTVTGTAGVRRWLGRDGALLMSARGWEPFLEPYQERIARLDAGEEDPAGTI